MPAARLGRCPTCKRRITRSSEQNRRYWALLFSLAEKVEWKGQHYSADQWHLYAKARFLGCVDMDIPGGKTIPVPNSTAELDVPEFANYMTAVEAFANEHGAFLEDDGVFA